MNNFKQRLFFIFISIVGLGLLSACKPSINKPNQTSRSLEGNGNGTAYDGKYGHRMLLQAGQTYYWRHPKGSCHVQGLEDSIAATAKVELKKISSIEYKVEQILVQLCDQSNTLIFTEEDLFLSKNSFALRGLDGYFESIDDIKSSPHVYTTSICSFIETDEIFVSSESEAITLMSSASEIKFDAINSNYLLRGELILADGKFNMGELYSSEVSSHEVQFNEPNMYSTHIFSKEGRWADLTITTNEFDSFDPRKMSTRLSLFSSQNNRFFEVDLSLSNYQNQFFQGCLHGFIDKSLEF